MNRANDAIADTKYQSDPDFLPFFSAPNFFVSVVGISLPGIAREDDGEGWYNAPYHAKVL